MAADHDHKAEQIEYFCFKAVADRYGPDVASRFTPKVSVSLGNVEYQDVAKMTAALTRIGYTLDPCQLASIDKGRFIGHASVRGE